MRHSRSPQLFSRPRWCSIHGKSPFSRSQVKAPDPDQAVHFMIIQPKCPGGLVREKLFARRRTHGTMLSKSGFTQNLSHLLCFLFSIPSALLLPGSVPPSSPLFKFRLFFLGPSFSPLRIISESLCPHPHLDPNTPWFGPRETELLL